MLQKLQHIPSGTDLASTAAAHPYCSMRKPWNLAKDFPTYTLQQYIDCTCSHLPHALFVAFLQADRATAAVNLEARYQVPPHLLFELLADPRQHDKIFDAILVSIRNSFAAQGVRDMLPLAVDRPGSCTSTRNSLWLAAQLPAAAMAKIPAVQIGCVSAIVL
jgi:mitochondrial fission protein ELM1